MTDTVRSAEQHGDEGYWWARFNRDARPVFKALLAALAASEQRAALYLRQYDELLERYGRAEADLAAAQRGSIGAAPTKEGGPGHEETYWLKRKLGASIRHLRDVEDYYRLRGGLPKGFNMIRADRARALYEAITEDFVNGKTTRPTRAELEAALAAARHQRDNFERIARECAENRHKLWLRVNELDPALAAARRALDDLVSFHGGLRECSTFGPDLVRMLVTREAHHAAVAHLAALASLPGEPRE